MIHYHGMPVSGTYIESTEFSKGRHVLVSYNYPWPIEWVHETCSSFCLDNGAFSLWKKKKEVNWDDYAKWVEQWAKHPSYDWCLIPDVIDGTEDDNRALVKQYGSSIKNAVPVYHMHESFDYLEELCNTFPRVALGSSGQWARPGTKDWWVRMSEILNVACDEEGFPKTKLHGLRMLNPAIFTSIPFSSADSTNAGTNSGSKGRFNSYNPAKAFMRAAIIASHIESHNSPMVWSGR